MSNQIFRRTKIIATIGPVTANYKSLVDLYKSGVNAFRLNFSHGNHAQHAEVVALATKLNKEYNAHVSLIADLQGPKLRLGEVEEGCVLKKDKIITITTEKVVGNEELIQVVYKKLPKDIKVNDTILIDDGKIELKVIATDKKKKVKAQVIYGGPLSSNKGFNLPNTSVSSPSLTTKDRKDLDFVLTLPFDWIALSFVRTAKEVNLLRKKITASGSQLKIISKIEKPEAIKNIDEIVQASDGIMIARGDLGVEMPLEEIPLLQKMIVRLCLRHAKPVIIATQVMESMMESARPSRAEITDAANGVLDGADALMLSGETSVGKHPVEVIETLDKIIRRIERENTIYHKPLLPLESSETFLSDAICFNACKISEDVGARGIVAMTYSGATAFKISSNRPQAEIYVFTSNNKIQNALNLIWGVQVFHYDKFVSTDETFDDVKSILTKHKHLKKGDILVNTASMPISRKGRTNMIKISYIR